MRTSKYLNKQFGNWVCTYVGIRNVQGVRTKHPGARNYFYAFERRTSDNKADKIIQLNSTEASLVYRGIKCVEEILNDREATKPTSYTRQISYSFN